MYIKKQLEAIASHLAEIAANMTGDVERVGESDGEGTYYGYCEFCGRKMEVMTIGKGQCPWRG